MFCVHCIVGTSFSLIPAAYIALCGIGLDQDTKKSFGPKFQAHFDRCPLPISDYITDTRSVLDQAARVLNSMLEITAGYGLLGETLGLLKLYQMIVQVRGGVDLAQNRGSVKSCSFHVRPMVPRLN